MTTTREHRSVSDNPMPTGPEKFRAQQIIVMPRAREDLAEEEIHEALERHFRCDWGDCWSVPQMDQAFESGEKVMSCFEAARPGPCPFYVETTPDRLTTFVHSEWEDSPEEYERKRPFLVDLAALLRRHGLAIRYDETNEGWAFKGDDFSVDVSDVAYTIQPLGGRAKPSS